MATRRIIVNSIPRSIAPIFLPSASRHFPIGLRISNRATGFVARQVSSAHQASQQRWYSAPPGDSRKIFDFEMVQKVSSTPKPTTILIDVREPNEYKDGFIPSALNMPITSNPDALFLSSDDFQARFGFPKPDVNKEVVFYCRSGVRSGAAAQLARQNGYKDVVEYTGSWLDWTKNGGVAAKPS